MDKDKELLPENVSEAKGTWYYGALCPNCDTDNPAGSRYCGQCGASLDGSMKFCDSCDSYCQVDSLFCGNCGAKLSDEVLSYRSGRIQGNGREMWALMLSFILPGYGLVSIGMRLAGLAFFVVAALLAVFFHSSIYFVIGAVSFGTALAVREK